MFEIEKKRNLLTTYSLSIIHPENVFDVNTFFLVLFFCFASLSLTINNFALKMLNMLQGFNDLRIEEYKTKRKIKLNYFTSGQEYK